MYCSGFFLHNNYGGKAMKNNSSDNNAKTGADARSSQLEEIKELGSVSSDGKHKIYCMSRNKSMSYLPNYDANCNNSLEWATDIEKQVEEEIMKISLKKILKK